MKCPCSAAIDTYNTVQMFGVSIFIFLSWKEIVSLFPQAWSISTVFNTDNNQKYFLSSKSAY